MYTMFSLHTFYLFIYLMSAEILGIIYYRAWRVKCLADNNLKFFSYFPRKYALTFHENGVIPYFLRTPPRPPPPKKKQKNKTNKQGKDYQFGFC